MEDQCSAMDMKTGFRLTVDVVKDRNDGGQQRQWLWSHHIYGKKKRRSMLEWCSELRLRGACLAGKPGLIVVEGDTDRVREFVRYTASGKPAVSPPD